MLAIYSGFRRGELLGLEWSDVNWDEEIIEVRRTSNYTREAGTYTDTPKTKKSARALKLPHYVFEVLKVLKTDQEVKRSNMGDKWFQSNRLFIRNNGTPLGTSTPYEWLKKTCKENNLRFCGIHAFRHFNASALISKGIDATIVSAALGHSKVGTTTDIYCHLFKVTQAMTCAAIADALDFTYKDKKDTEEDAKI